MKMILAVNNTANLENGIKATSVFDTHGGVIGSSPLSNWQLLDRSHTVADSHVRVFFQDGMFCAVPLDEAGIFINQASRPTPPGTSFSISDGDDWRVGGFEISVYLSLEEGEDNNQQLAGREWAGRFSSIESIVPGTLQNQEDRERVSAESILADHSKEEDEKANFFATRDRSAKDEIDPLEILNKSTSIAQDLGKDPLSMFDAEPGNKTMSRDDELIEDLNVRPTQSGKAQGLDDPVAQNAFYAGPQSNNSNEEIDSYLQELANGNGEAPQNIDALREREEWHGRVSSGEFEENELVDHVVLRPLLSAMGLPVADMTVPEANRVAREAGDALRSAVNGLIEIHKNQGTDRTSLNETHLHPVEDNPLRLGEDQADVMKDLFLVQSPVHLNAPAAIEESLAQISAHEKASQTAIDAALGAVLAALAPKQLSHRFTRYKGHAPRSGDMDAWHWQMYQHYYAEMKSDRQRGLGRMFWEVFSQVYDREVRSSALNSHFDI